MISAEIDLLERLDVDTGESVTNVPGYFCPTRKREATRSAYHISSNTVIYQRARNVFKEFCECYFLIMSDINA